MKNSQQWSSPVEGRWLWWFCLCRRCRWGCRCGSSRRCRSCRGAGLPAWSWPRLCPRSRSQSGCHNLKTHGGVEVSVNRELNNPQSLLQCVTLHPAPALRRTLRAVGCHVMMPTRLEWYSRTTTGVDSGVTRPFSGISQIWWGHERTHKDCQITSSISFKITRTHNKHTGGTCQKPPEEGSSE